MCDEGGQATCRRTLRCSDEGGGCTQMQDQSVYHSVTAQLTIQPSSSAVPSYSHEGESFDTAEEAHALRSCPPTRAKATSAASETSESASNWSLCASGSAGASTDATPLPEGRGRATTRVIPACKGDDLLVTWWSLALCSPLAATC